MKNVAILLASLALLAACGGSDNVTIGENTAADAGPLPSGTGNPGGGDGTQEDTGNPPSRVPDGGTGTDVDGCAKVAWYFDGDGDGFGGARTQSSCTTPGDKWTTKGGDCDDANDLVFPGQTRWFGESYVGNGAAASFDYDCSQVWEEKPDQPKAAAECTVSGNTCLGAGYLPIGPTGIANVYCGSKRYRSCRFVAGGGTGTASTCVSIAGGAEGVFECH